MSTKENTASPREERNSTLRLWPAIGITLMVLAAITAPTMLAPGTVVQLFGMMLGPLVGTALMAVWWLFFSRCPSTIERIVGVLFAAIAAAVTYFVSAESVRPGLMIFGTTSMMAVITAWFLLSRSLSWKAQRTGAASVIVVTSAVWGMLRGDGVDGLFRPKFSWRWASTREEKYLESLAAAAVQGAALKEVQPLQAAPGDWVGFRGQDRSGKVTGVRLATDWQAKPPQEIWRRSIGPGWSSFAVVGDRLYTQEQRGDEEVVLCLAVADGQQLWAHSDPARFWEAMAGAGPRATPTFDRGTIYATGATGKLNCLNAVTGERIWSRDIGEDGEAKVPPWGFAGSPLVVNDTVLVYAGGGPGKGIIAYDCQSGRLLWQGGGGTHSYSSPQLVSFDGILQVLMLTERGVFAISPESGESLWEHEWPVEGMNRTVQPNVDGHRVFLGTGFGLGTKAIAVLHEGASWKTAEQWTSTALKPYYNDFVAYEGQLYGFDGNIFACADIESGKRKWKQGRYGNGQVLLIADQGLLLVLTEWGEVVLLKANPARHEELAKLPAISGKTWNHPVIAHGKLFVRNAEEAACFALPTVDADAEL